MVRSGGEGLYGRPVLGVCSRSPTGEHREQDAGDHQGLVKIPRIFLALPNPASLARVLDKSALYDWR